MTTISSQLTCSYEVYRDTFFRQSFQALQRRKFHSKYLWTSRQLSRKRGGTPLEGVRNGAIMVFKAGNGKKTFPLLQLVSRKQIRAACLEFSDFRGCFANSGITHEELPQSLTRVNH